MRIAFCYPSRPMVHARFAVDLTTVVGITAKAGHEVAVYNNLGTVIFSQRQSLAEAALEDGADWLMWLDSDMRFPHDAALRLLKHGKDIVGCNYATKEFPPGPTAKTISANNEWMAKHTRPTDKGIEKVAGIGMGVMLTSAKVFKAIEKPWFLFPFSLVNNQPLGEDLYLCEKARRAGFDTWLDHDLSRDVRHIGEFEFSLDHIDACLEQEAAAA